MAQTRATEWSPLKGAHGEDGEQSQECSPSNSTQRLSCAHRCQYRESHLTDSVHRQRTDRCRTLVTDLGSWIVITACGFAAQYLPDRYKECSRTDSYNVTYPSFGSLAPYSNAMVVLDYLFFPHIFAEIIAQCDFETQNKLRLLSSSAKQHVDRYQCRFCIVHLGRHKRDSYFDGYYAAPHMHVDDARRFPTLRIPMLQAFPPCSGNSLREECRMVTFDFAMRCRTQRVTVCTNELIFDLHFALVSQEGCGLPHSSALNILGTARYLTLFHKDYMYISMCRTLRLYYYSLGSPHDPIPFSALYPEDISLPSSVKELHVCLSEDECLCQTRVDHSAEILRVTFAEGMLYRSVVCDFAKNLFRPCVQRLILQVDHPELATKYFATISGLPANPQLEVSVTSWCGGFNKRRERRRTMALWKTILGTPVEWYLDDDLKLDVRDPHR